jgi:hypothetical protein
MVLIDYEGQAYGQANLHVYADRVLHAADRHRQRYPTVAREKVHEEELIRVGDYDEEIGAVILEYDGSSKDPMWAYELLSRWIEVGRGFLPGQLKATGHVHEWSPVGEAEARYRFEGRSW